MLRLSLAARAAAAAVPSASFVSSTIAHAALPSSVSLSPDPSLVNIPNCSGSCFVFRNVLSDYDEELIVEEFSRILPQEGKKYFADPSKVEEKALRNVQLELYGHRDWTEVQNPTVRGGVKRIPGFAWSPTLLRFSERVARPFFGGSPPDTAKVVEHHQPGYEMHTEHPTVGSAFLYLNLASDAVVQFDDEATQRSGMVYLPQRSLMYVAGELRWGWRFGEHAQREKVYVGPSGLRKRVVPDLRLSIQLSIFNAKMIDRRDLQNALEDAVRKAKSTKSAEAAAPPSSATASDARLASDSARGTRDAQVEEGSEESGNPFAAALEDSARRAKDPNAKRPRFKLPDHLREGVTNTTAVSSPPKGASLSQTPGRRPAAATTKPGGLLGGDFVEGNAAPGGAKKTLADLQRDLVAYKESYGNVQSVLQGMQKKQEANEPLTEEWMNEKMAETRAKSAKGLDADYAFDPANPEQFWEEADVKSRSYKQKLKAMNYDGDSSAAAKAFDLGFDPESEGSLNVSETLGKLAPHLKKDIQALTRPPRKDA